MTHALLHQSLGGKYQLNALIGQGEMGAVFRGRHQAMGREVAVKVLDASAGEPEMLRRRFAREAQLVSQLQHPSTITLYDYGEQDALLYLVMEHVEGETLKAHLDREGAMAPGRAVALMMQLLGSLEEAHHHGILHRDLKPANLMLTRDFRGQEQLKVLDFGVATIWREPKEGELLALVEGAARTQSQGFIGTPRYAAPEQIMMGQLSPATDLYAAGLILWELLLGVPAARHKQVRDCLLAHLSEAPWRLPSASGRWSRALASVVHRALEKDPSRRYQSSASFAQALSQVMAASVDAAADEGDEALLGVEEQLGGVTPLIDPNLMDDEEHAQARALQSAPVVVRAPQGRAQAQPGRVPSGGGAATPQPHLVAPQAPPPALTRASPQELSAMAHGLPRATPQEIASAAARCARRPQPPRWRRAVGLLGVLSLITLVALLAAQALGVKRAEEVPDEGARLMRELEARLDRETRPVAPQEVFSDAGIDQAIQAAGWRREGAPQGLLLGGLHQQTTRYVRDGASVEVNIVSARAPQALQDYVSGVHADARRVALSETKVVTLRARGSSGAGSRALVGLEEHLGRYRALVLSQEVVP